MACSWWSGTCVPPAIIWSSEESRSSSYRSSTVARTVRPGREKASTSSGVYSSAILTETAGASSRYQPVPRYGRSLDMGKVTSGLTMSLDGFIAGPNDGPEHPLGVGGMRLFDWYSSGDTDYVVPSGEMTFRVSSQAAEMLQEVFSEIGALVTGRRTFDITNGWGGRHPIDVPVFVVTHTVPQELVTDDSPFTFVTDG